MLIVGVMFWCCFLVFVECFGGVFFSDVVWGVGCFVNSVLFFFFKLRGVCFFFFFWGGGVGWGRSMGGVDRTWGRVMGEI